MDFKVENILATAKYQGKIDVDKVSRKYWSSRYHEEAYGACQVKFRESGATFGLFDHGKFTITGATSETELDDAVRLFAKKIVPPLSDRKLIVTDVKIENILATADLKQHIDLVRLVRKSRGIKYDPKKFPAAFVHFKKPDGTVTLFASGKLTVTGLSTLPSINEVVSKVKSIVSQQAAPAKPISLRPKKMRARVENPALHFGGAFVMPKRRKSPLDFNVENVLATADLDTNLDLFRITEKIKSARFKHGPMGVVQIDLNDPDSTMAMFANGKITSAGCASQKELSGCFRKVYAMIKPPLSDDEPRLSKIQVENILATADFKKPLNLQKIARAAKNAEYKPATFPAVVLRFKKPDAAVELFENGKLTCIGTRTIKDLDDVLAQAAALVYSVMPRLAERPAKTKVVKAGKVKARPRVILWHKQRHAKLNAFVLVVLLLALFSTALMRSDLTGPINGFPEIVFPPLVPVAPVVNETFVPQIPSGGISGIAQGPGGERIAQLIVTMSEPTDKAAAAVLTFYNGENQIFYPEKIGNVYDAGLKSELDDPFIIEINCNSLGRRVVSKYQFNFTEPIMDYVATCDSLSGSTYTALSRKTASTLPGTPQQEPVQSVPTAPEKFFINVKLVTSGNQTGQNITLVYDDSPADPEKRTEVSNLTNSEGFTQFYIFSSNLYSPSLFYQFTYPCVGGGRNHGEYINVYTTVILSC
ncbi:MAG: hypothetical protein J4432_04190 [DPANN group archaeon]|nr:hypothetical protein [DPANN group archaeon]